MSELFIVLPFHRKDYRLMAGCIEVMHMMHGKLPRRAMLHTDDGCGQGAIGHVMREAVKAFAEVEINVFKPSPVRGWPGAPNWSFVQAALMCQALGVAGWLWLEADANAIRKDWLSIIEDEYFRCGKPFMGTIIEGCGHMNGVGIYPGRYFDYSRSNLGVFDRAFDVVHTDDIIKHVHKANHLIHHEHAGMPSFRHMHDVRRLIPATVCVYHPVKDGSLSRALLQQQRR